MSTEKLLEKISDKLDAIGKSDKEVMTITDVTDLTGWKAATVYQLIHKGEIPHYKPTNGTVFFKRSEIKEWIFKEKISA